MFALEGLSREENDVLAPIVKTVIIDDVAGFMYLAMTEFGESLSDVLDRGEVPMNPEDTALSLSYLVARMHSLGIVHMDIKTCNIFVAQH
jgi:tRNA A-37 threonylcarbamoyl transferase component Bud32